ncbi:MAG: hypothetical protein U0271_23335 [Polyangiaceae bacterium]
MRQPIVVMGLIGFAVALGAACGDELPSNGGGGSGGNPSSGGSGGSGAAMTTGGSGGQIGGSGGTGGSGPQACVLGESKLDQCILQ